MSEQNFDDSQELDDLLGELAEEYAQRMRDGEKPDIEEYARRYPAIADVIRQVLPALNVMGILPVEESSPATRSDEPPEALGDFRILRELGRGGMGIVYEAEQISLSRSVALKVLPFASVLDDRQVQRFKNEALAAAQLNHPHIIDVYGVGCERSVHYFAMRLIEGETLAGVISQLSKLRGDSESPAEESMSQAALSVLSGTDGGRADPLAATFIGGKDSEEASSAKNRLARSPSSTAPMAALSTDGTVHHRAFFRSVARIGAEVAGAIDYAHQEGIIHRDIKPANIMLDAAGKAWVADFGLARVNDDLNLTMTGDLLGTIRYMSPEQALAKRVVIDHRTDIYSLGVTLYELVTQQPAFPQTDRQELLQRIGVENPTVPRRLNPAIPVALETIILKAIAKNPADRYETAKQMADDLQRFLNEQPIRARRPPISTRLHLWTRRHPVVTVSSAVAGIVALLGLAAVALLTARHERSARETAEDATRRETGLRIAAEEARRVMEQAQQRERIERVKAERFAEIDRRRAIDLNVSTGIASLNRGDPARALPWFVDALQLMEDEQDQSIQRMRIGAALSRAAKPVAIGFHKGAVRSADLSSDGSRIVTASDDGTARVWSATTGEQLTTPLDHGGFAIEDVEFSPNGRLIATAGADQRVRVWNAETGMPITESLPHVNHVDHVSFSPDGKLVVGAASDSGMSRIWSVATGTLLQTLHATGHEGRFSDAVFGTDGQTLLTFHHGGIPHTVDYARMFLWDVADGTLIRQQQAHRNGFLHVGLDRKRRRIVTTSRDNSARVWDMNTLEPVTRPLLHKNWVDAAQFCDNGEQLVTASLDGTASIWDVSTGKRLVELSNGKRVMDATFNHDGTRVATGDADGIVRLWHSETGEQIGPPMRHSGSVNRVMFGRTGRKVVTCSDDQTVRIWDLAGMESPPEAIHHREWMTGVRFVNDDQHVISQSRKGRYYVWDADTGRQLQQFTHGPLGAGYDVSSNGKQLATISEDRVVKLWSLDTGRRHWQSVQLLPGKTIEYLNDAESYASVKFDAASRALLASASRNLLDGELQDTFSAWRIFNAKSGKPLGPEVVLTGRQNRITDCCFSRDGENVFIALGDKGGAGGEIRVYSSATGKPLSVKQNAPYPIRVLTLGPNGKYLAIGSGQKDYGSGLALIWDWENDRVVGEKMLHESPVDDIRFTPDGSLLLTATTRSSSRVWDAMTGVPMTPPITLDNHRVYDSAFNSNGRLFAIAAGQPNPNSTSSGFVQVFETSTGKALTSRIEHAAHVFGVAFDTQPQLATACKDGTSRVYPLPIATQSLEELRRLAQLLSGVAIDRTGGESPLTPSLLEQAWSFLSQSTPETFSVSPQQVIAWTVSQGQQESRVQDYTSAWNAIKSAATLIKTSQKTNDSEILAERAKAFADLKLWKFAAADWWRAEEKDPDLQYTIDVFDHLKQTGRWSEALEFGIEIAERSEGDGLWWLRVAPLVALDDENEYRRLCARISQDSQKAVNLWTADRICKACLLLPESVDIDRLPTDVLEKSLKAGKGPSWAIPFAWSTQALVSYRSGDAEAAIASVKKSMDSRPNSFNVAVNETILALAHEDLGNDKTARIHSTRAERLIRKIQRVDWMKGHHDLLIPQILHREVVAKLAYTAPAKRE